MTGSSRLGGAALQGGVYVSPHPWDDAVRHEAKRLDLADHLSLATTDDLEIGGVRDPRQLAPDLVADRRRRGRATRRSSSSTATFPISSKTCVGARSGFSDDHFLPVRLRDGSRDVGVHAH